MYVAASRSSLMSLAHSNDNLYMYACENGLFVNFW